MDFSGLNKAAETPQATKIKDLPLRQPIKIDHIRPLETRYGNQLIVEFGEQHSFLPKRVTEYLFSNVKEYKKLEESIAKSELDMIYMGDEGISFCQSKDVTK